MSEEKYQKYPKRMTVDQNPNHNEYNARMERSNTDKMTLDQIKEWGIGGNAYSDMPTINACHRLIMNPEFSVEERCEALDYMSNDVMGLDEPKATIADLEQYLKDVEDQMIEHKNSY